MTRSNSTPNPFTNELNPTTPSNNITNITSTEVPFDQLQNQPSTSTSTSLQDRRNSIKTTLPPNTKTNLHKTNHYQSFPRHSIHQINSQPIIHHHHHHHQSNSSTKSNSLNSNHQHTKIEPSSPKPNYSNGFLNSSSSSTTTSLTLHHDSSPASISFDKPSTISFLSDLISNDPLSSNHQPHKLNRYSLTSSPTVLSSSSVLRPTTTTTNITNTITTASPTALASSSNPMPTSPITSTSNSNSTSTNSSILNSNTSNPSTVTTPNTSLTTSTRAVPSRSNTLTVPLNHTANSITNNGRNPRGLRSSDGTNPSLQSSSSSSHPHPQQQQQQVPPSPSPSRGEPSNGGGSTNAHTGQLEAKVVILGMQGVGKTSIVHRYTTGSFSYSLASTIGASFCTKKLSVDGCKVRLQIWDTAGQERFRSMAPMYYRGANAAILVYDITNQSSFEDIQNWLHELSANMSPELVIQIVGSKADLATDKRSVELEVAYQQILEWTESFPFQNQTSNQTHGRDVNHSWPDLAITEVSAKDDFGIEDMFLVVTRRLVMRKAEIEEIRLRKSRESILIEPRDSLNKSNQFHPSENGSSWCC
ncbi:P-loop containing nucleoside triphosphate hydrolase protein [Melampsora americana]|nr:P-loop containing nucleoside triphosphate hydrolase protein [Melampsora americana]